MKHLFVNKTLAVILLFTSGLLFAKEKGSVFEAETGDFYGVKSDTTLKGYSGEGYVQYPSYDQGILRMVLNVPQTGDYCMFLHLLNAAQNDTEISGLPERIKRFQLEQQQGDITHIVTSQRLPVTKKFEDVQVNCVLTLQQGDAEFYLTGMEGEWQLDYVTLQPATEKMKESALPSRTLVNKKATKEAQAVYEYLCDMQGKGILSGQQMYNRTPEMTAIYTITGKYPAILGIDLIDYSPSRVAHGTRGVTANDAIKWWNDGGLVTCCWHWNAPLGLVDLNETNKHWYDGFRPESTTFDFATALNNPKSEEYKALISDIDTIAVPLKKMQDAGLAVLWRPLHEASGAWFWWGAHESGPYIKLYRLLYDRLTNYHQINNLIWVWNGQDPSWYPGDDVVDIISDDVYPGKHEYKTSEDRLSIVRSSTERPKLVAMSENGTLPDIDAIAEEKIPWSWFCTWNGEFTVDKTNKYSGKYTAQDVLERYYENSYVITRDQLPVFHK